jgi:hypothetical protein
MPALRWNAVLDRKKNAGGGFLEPIAPILMPQAGVLGSQPPVPVIALTCAFPRPIASQIDADG